MFSFWLSARCQAHYHETYTSHFYNYLSIWSLPHTHHFGTSANFFNIKYQVTEVSIACSIWPSHLQERARYLKTEERNLWEMENKEEKENSNTLTSFPVSNGCLPGWLLCGASPLQYSLQTPSGLPNSLQPIIWRKRQYGKWNIGHQNLWQASQILQRICILTLPCLIQIPST